jgi:RNA polymerase sigma-70 factor (ECF subfamily)
MLEEDPVPERSSDHARFAANALPHLDAGYNLARWLTGNAQDAQDVVQEACVRALRYGAGFHGGNARAWFLTIVRHACFDWLERNRPAEIARGHEDAVDAAVDEVNPGPFEIAVRSAQSRALADALAQLPLPIREVVVLRELEELSYKEIARVADIPIGTVMSRLARARGLLSRSPLLRAIRDRAVGDE